MYYTKKATYNVHKTHHTSHFICTLRFDEQALVALLESKRYAAIVLKVIHGLQLLWTFNPNNDSDYLLILWVHTVCKRRTGRSALRQTSGAIHLQLQRRHAAADAHTRQWYRHRRRHRRHRHQRWHIYSPHRTHQRSQTTTSAAQSHNLCGEPNHRRRVCYFSQRFAPVRQGHMCCMCCIAHASCSARSLDRAF